MPEPRGATRSVKDGLDAAFTAGTYSADSCVKRVREALIIANCVSGFLERENRK